MIEFVLTPGDEVDEGEGEGEGWGTWERPKEFVLNWFQILKPSPHRLTFLLAWDV